MIDCIEAVVAANSATAYVKPTASIFTVERGKIVLHVARGRAEALALLAAKRAHTRDERYAMSVKLIEDSILPEKADAPVATVASEAADLLMRMTFELLPHYDALEELVMRKDWGLDAFWLPKTPESKTGFGVVRTPAGPLLETFHTRKQASDFLARHEAYILEEELKEAEAEFGSSPLASSSRLAPEAFGGFSAALIGAHERMYYELGRSLRRP